jgi:TonB family protein
MTIDSNIIRDKYFYASFALHFLIFSLLILNQNFLPSSLFGLDEDKVTIIEPAVRVDLVQMPTMTLQELKKLDLSATSPEPTTANSEPDTSSELETKSVANPEQPEFQEETKAKSFAEVLKELSAKKIQKKKADSTPNKESNSNNNKLSGKQQAQLQKLLLAGNRLSEGTASQGSGTAELQGFHAYMSKLPDHVRPHWKLPSYLMGQGLKCRIRVYLNQQGQVVQSKIWETSGNPEYDQRAIQAITQSQPFPLYDKEYVSRAISGEIVLGFPL